MQSTSTSRSGRISLASIVVLTCKNRGPGGGSSLRSTTLDNHRSTSHPPTGRLLRSTQLSHTALKLSAPSSMFLRNTFT